MINANLPHSLTQNWTPFATHPVHTGSRGDQSDPDFIFATEHCVKEHKN